LLIDLISGRSNEIFFRKKLLRLSDNSVLLIPSDFVIIGGQDETMAIWNTVEWWFIIGQSPITKAPKLFM
jgi:hypothetical protein